MARPPRAPKPEPRHPILPSGAVHNGRAASTNITWHDGNISREERWKLLECRGACIWFTGLSASGKSTIACALEQVLVQAGKPAYRLDGDNIRHGLNKNLGFSAADRAENIGASARSPASSPTPAPSR